MPWSDVTTTSVFSSSPASSSTFERPADLLVAPLDFDGVVEQVAADDLGVGQVRGTFTSASFLPSRTPEPSS